MGSELQKQDLPSVPEAAVIYAVGDIHGEYDILMQMLDCIQQDARIYAKGLHPTIVFLGDYVDRGPKIRAVVDCLCGEAPSGALRGNHEQAMLDFINDPVANVAWLNFGGRATLQSYSVAPPSGKPDSLLISRNHLQNELPDHHTQWLNNLTLSLVIGDFAFVHAGIRPGVTLSAQSKDDLLWIREPFLGYQRRFEKTIVHGHTISPFPEYRPNRIGLDTGAFSSGILSCAALQGNTVRLLRATRNSHGYWPKTQY